MFKFFRLMKMQATGWRRVYGSLGTVGGRTDMQSYAGGFILRHVWPRGVLFTATVDGISDPVYHGPKWPAAFAALVKAGAVPDWTET